MRGFKQTKNGCIFFGICLLLVLVPAYSQTCRTVAYTIVNQYYVCSTKSYTVISNSQLPASFNGAMQVTFGFWWKNVLTMSCVTGGWEMMFKVSADITNYWSRWPAIYHKISGGNQQIYFGADQGAVENNTLLNVPIVTGGWYYMVVTANCYLNRFYYYVYDPSKVVTQLTDGVVWTSDLIFPSTGVFPYTSSQFLIFGSDPVNTYYSDVIMSFPSVIAGQCLSSYTDITMMAYSLFSVVSFTVDFFGTSVMRHVMEYDTNTDVLDTTSTFPYSYDYGTSDGTAQTNLSNVWTVPGLYQTAQLDSPTQTLVLSPSRNYSFIDNWGFLAFGARVVFRMTSMTYSGCNYHWLFRRVQIGTGTVKFGLGIKADGTVVVNVGGLLGTSSTTGFVTVNTWTTLKIGCFNRGFTNKILCLILNSDGLSQARQEIYISYASNPYASDATTDKLLFGGSSCGSSSIYWFETNFGNVPELMDQCKWGCSQKLPSSGYCTLVGHWSNACPSTPSVKVASRKECTKCPSGCSTCQITDFTNMTMICTSCLSGLTLSSQGLCECAYGSYYDMISGSCQTQTVVYAYLALTSGTQYQFKVTFSSTIPDLQMITNVIQAEVVNGDYSGNSVPTITVVNYQYLQIDFSPEGTLEDGTTLWVRGLTNYNQLPYNPYIIKPETLSYVFGLVPPYTSTTVAVPPAPIVYPLVYGPRNPTYVISGLNILFGVMGSPAMMLIKVLSDITLYKFINVGFQIISSISLSNISEMDL